MYVGCCRTDTDCISGPLCTWSLGSSLLISLVFSHLLAVQATQLQPPVVLDSNLTSWWASRLNSFTLLLSDSGVATLLRSRAESAWSQACCIGMRYRPFSICCRFVFRSVFLRCSFVYCRALLRDACCIVSTISTLCPNLVQGRAASDWCSAEDANQAGRWEVKGLEHVVTSFIAASFPCKP